MIKAGVVGVEDVVAALKEKAPKIALNLLRATTYGVASQMAKEIKADAPELSGELKKSVKPKRLNQKGKSRNIVASAVLINAKTPPTPNRPDGTYKWLHVEYGTQHSAAEPFVTPVVVRTRSQIPSIFSEQFAKKLAKQVAKEMKNKK